VEVLQDGHWLRAELLLVYSSAKQDLGKPYLARIIELYKAGGVAVPVVVVATGELDVVDYAGALAGGVFIFDRDDKRFGAGCA
jgi:hypothetical protein